MQPMAPRSVASDTPEASDLNQRLSGLQQGDPAASSSAAQSTSAAATRDSILQQQPHQAQTGLHMWAHCE
jgi:hypothetical protein